jgi:hypothetical protein
LYFCIFSLVLQQVIAKAKNCDTTFHEKNFAMDIQDKTNKELRIELTELQREFPYFNALIDSDTAKRQKFE